MEVKLHAKQNWKTILTRTHACVVLVLLLLKFHQFHHIDLEASLKIN